MQSLWLQFTALPAAVRIGLIALVVVQLITQIIALVDLARRARVPGGRKWVWVLIIVVGNLLGALVYLAVGRSAPAPESVESAADTATRDRAIDRLYGDAGRR